MDKTKPKYKYGDRVKDLSGKDVGSAVFDPDTGNPLTGAQAFNPNTGDAIKNVITPDLLKGAQPIPLPKENLTNPVADKVLSIADTAVEGAKTEANTSQDNYVKALKDVMTTTDKLGTYEEQAGAKKAEKTSRDLGNQVNALVRNFSAFIQEVNNDPMIVGAVKDRRVSAEKTRVANTVADLQFTKSLVDQNLTDARKWAKDKIDLELRPLELEVENKKFVRDNAQKFFTDTQMKLLDSQIKQKEDLIADMREQKKKNLEMYTQASVQEAPPDLLARSKEAIDAGKSTSEVVGILGKYAGDIYKTELLKEQIQTEKAQRANIWNTIANRDADNTRQNAAAVGGLLKQEDIAKAIESKAGVKTIATKGLVTELTNLKNLYDKYGARPTTAEGIGAIQSARSSAQLAITAAFGQGAISDGDRDSYTKLTGTGFSVSPTANLNQAIQTQKKNYETNIAVLDTAYPGIKALTVFQGGTPEDIAADALIETNAKVDEKINNPSPTDMSQNIIFSLYPNLKPTK